MAGPPDWIPELPAAVTVTGPDGTILAMNDAADRTFARDGGRGLVGSSVFDCHPEPAKTRTKELYKDPRPNHYTIRKNGQKKIIHQLPWYQGGRFAGVVEVSIPIPDSLPHFERD